jgi:hypothetical protein
LISSVLKIKVEDVSIFSSALRYKRYSLKWPSANFVHSNVAVFSVELFKDKVTGFGA